jgi:hypothetical protein
MEQRLAVKISDVEDRLTEKMRDSETRLLSEIWQWVAPLTSGSGALTEQCYNSGTLGSNGRADFHSGTQNGRKQGIA